MSSLETERPAYRVNEPGMRERQAYVTLLTDDHFSIGAFVLLRSLRNAIKSVSGGTDGRSIVVMVTEVGFSIFIYKRCVTVDGGLVVELKVKNKVTNPSRG